MECAAAALIAYTRSPDLHRKTAFRIHVDNYGTCRADQARLTDLQEWVRQQAALWDKP